MDKIVGKITSVVLGLAIVVLGLAFVVLFGLSGLCNTPSRFCIDPFPGQEFYLQLPAVVLTILGFQLISSVVKKPRVKT